MKRIVFLVAIAAVVFMVGCKSGGGSGGVAPQGVQLTCADVKNDGQVSDCATVPVAFNAAVVGIEIQAGVVSRGQHITATLQADNPDVSAWAGGFDMVFDSGCVAGETTWRLVDYREVVIDPGQSWMVSIGGTCSQMALGDRTLTATLYEADGVTQRDQVIVHFTLTE